MQCAHVPQETSTGKEDGEINSQCELECEAQTRAREVLTSFRLFFLDTARAVHGLIHDRVAGVDHV